MIMSSAVAPDILYIIGKCSKDEKFNEYVIKFVKRLLNGFAVTYNKRRSMAYSAEKEWAVIQAHRRASYIELIKGMLDNVSNKYQFKIKILI